MWILSLLALYLFSAGASYVVYLREHLTLQEVDSTVKKLSKKVHNLDETIQTQEKRMGAASTQASQAQALLHATKS
jgi:outer membrane murein-binding lipoprotein Lpp